ncbi:MAG: hypothetical protein ACO3EE_10180 [Flavobacteriales bacterium]
MKNKIILLLVVVLVGAAVYLWLKPNEDAAFREEMREFGVKNIDAIDEIIISEKGHDSIVLTKQGESWKVNGKFMARPDLMQTLLTTINKVKVKNRIPKEGIKQLTSLLAVHHKAVQIYANDELIKSYWVGGKTMDSRGTYMLMQNADGENASTPFVTHIEGFEGYLTERYVAQEDLWRDAHLFYFPEMGISTIMVDYPENKAQSFKIQIDEKNIELFPLNSDVAAPKLNMAALKTYLLNYKEVAAESFITKNNITKRDSLLKTTPLFVITVIDNKNNKNVIKGYRRKTLPGEVNYLGQHTEYDVDRLFGITSNDKELCILQYYIFDRLTKNLSDFTNF